MRRVLTSVALVAGVSGLLSCGRSPDAAATPRQPVSHTVVIEGMKFEPETITVAPGDTIVWVNKDLFPHTATSEGNFNSQGIDAAKSWEFKPTAKGDFTYVCTFHPTMKGTVKVN